jgi:hypothetical protein
MKLYKMRNQILKYSGILLIGLLFEWWLIFYSPLNLPKRIPLTPIKIDGLLLTALIISILIFSQKSFLKIYNDLSIFKLTLLGSSICFLAELFFQLIRQPTLNAEGFNEKSFYFFLGVIGVTLFGTIFSFFIAFQLKTKRTGILILMIILFIVLVNIIKYFFPFLFGPI